MSELHMLSIAQASDLIARRRLSPVELVQAFLSRIETLDPTYRAYVLVRGDQALAEAKELEAEIGRGRYRGPLHGIPIALKDIIETRGIPTSAGSALLSGNIPARDAHVWERLKAAGAVLLGKLETHEFANGGPRRASDEPYALRALNPWNPHRYAGGSSNGCASAVAAGLCMGAVGSDTGGSIRIPAAYCGVYGLKPTYGLVSVRGVLPVSQSLDHCGPMTWTAADAALMLGAMAGHDPDDPYSIPASTAPFAEALTENLRGLRVGFVRHFSHEDVNASESVNGAIDGALGVLRGLGATVSDVRLPKLAEFTAANTIILLSEAYTNHEAQLRERNADYTEYTRDRLTLGAFIRAADYLNAQRLRQELTAEFDAALTGLDVLVCACTPGTAPDAELAANKVQKFFFLGAPVLAAPFNAVGAPAASVCCGFDADGMPIAMQISAARGNDRQVLRASFAYERATSWRGRRPMEFAG